MTAIRGILDNKYQDGQDVYEAKLCVMGTVDLKYVTDDGEEQRYKEERQLMMGSRRYDDE